MLLERFEIMAGLTIFLIVANFMSVLCIVAAVRIDTEAEQIALGHLFELVFLEIPERECDVLRTSDHDYLQTPIGSSWSDKLKSER